MDSVALNLSPTIVGHDYLCGCLSLLLMSEEGALGRTELMLCDNITLVSTVLGSRFGQILFVVHL